MRSFWVFMLPKTLAGQTHACLMTSFQTLPEIGLKLFKMNIDFDAGPCEQNAPCQWIDAPRYECGGRWCDPGIDPFYCRPPCNGYIDK